MTSPKTPQGPTLHSPEGLEIVYSNLARIAHSPADIIIDFAHLLPGEKTATIRSRVVLSPLSAKMLLHALAENLKRYENSFGVIQVPGESSLAEHLFRPNQPPEPPKEDEP